MPAPAWLQVSGVSLSTDTNNTLVDPSAATLPNESVPPATTFDENENHRTIQKFEHADLAKKLFLDRQIKKAKSLPGLIKGTALYRHTPLQSPQYHKSNVDDSKPVSVDGNPDDHLSSSTQQLERPQEARRPRVVFADVNRVQFYDDDNDEIDSNRIRRSRHRSAKRSTPLIVPNPAFAPSIQQSQSLYVPASSTSSSFARQQDLNIKKQPIVASPRIHSSRITHLPDINNQSSTGDTPIRERYILQREKSFLRFPEPAAEQSLNSSAEVSRESTRAGGTRPFAMPYVSDLNIRVDNDENAAQHFLNNSFTSSMPTSRQRTTFQSISLRQQFSLPNKMKTTTHSRRSSSMRHSSQYSNISEEETNGLSSNHYDYVAPIENRPLTGSSSSRRIQRNYISHFNTSKVPSNGHSTMTDSHSNDHSLKSNHLYESSQETFEQPLKILSSSYLTNLHQPTAKKSTIDGSLRSSRTNSTRRSREFQVTSNTVIV